MRDRERLIVALDTSDLKQASRIVDLLAPHVGMFKVGMQLYYSHGPEAVREIMRRGAKVFLDLKLHDIPNTVARAVEVMVDLGVFMFNLHVAGGREMLKRAAETARSRAQEKGVQKPLILGVTVLTSLDEKALREEIGIPKPLRETVKDWAYMAKEAGLDGVVASAQEVELIRKVCGDDFVIVTPGIRPAWAEHGDQKRVTSPAEAVAAGATYLVVGRPVTAAPDPVEAVRKIMDEMEGL
ncbi:orotidine-5'-phosphate decarboxylase [Calderihabitans maritimus]|uniref:Orotidine 5'-phosphate decarboxylase n=1 Tax=Calderihabitans maritimus TaxID=1246530 RepID=A0A1Z5HWY4_9FIRM|nr:orotidine-5'-phosphate decarboxylase [Calderihabitans maritimus]GAW93928.1 orotidine 5'-phosphate decarboxylase [Calderihabitans maritimus]